MDSQEQFIDQAIEKVDNPERPEDDYFPIMSLPVEVRTAIYNLITQKEIINTRLVCKQWNAEIDQFYSFDGYIDDRINNWNKQLNLHLKSCTIIHLNQPQQIILKFPAELKKLNLLPALTKITPFQVYNILASLPNLEELKLKLSSIWYDTIRLLQAGLSLSNLSFKYLKSLELIEVVMENSFAAKSTVYDCFLKMLTNSSLRSLKCLKIEGCIAETNICSNVHNAGLLLNYFTPIINCLVNNPLLETFILSIALEKPDMVIVIPPNVTLLKSTDFKGLNQLNNLKSVQIKSNGICNNIWIDILERQRNLRILDINLGFPSLSNFSIYKIVENNYKSLTNIIIISSFRSSSCNQHSKKTFDLAIFAECIQLQELRIERNNNSSEEIDIDFVDFINLHRLPLSLTKLCINGFNLKTQELFLYVTAIEISDKRTLESIVIKDCGNGKQFGMNALTLEKLILMDLKETNISGFNRDDPAEATKFDRILPRFRHESVVNYFYRNLQ